MAEAKKPTKARASRASALKSAAPVAPAYASKYTVGDQISHPMFGDGTVTAIHTNKLTIEFPDSVIKQIVDDFVTRRQL
jgi:hypothetical protein